MSQQTEWLPESHQLLKADQRKAGVENEFRPAPKTVSTTSHVETLGEWSSKPHSAQDDRPTDQPPGWVSKPRRLDRTITSACLDWVFHIFMLLIPLPFFGLAASVASIDGMAVVQSEFHGLLEATKIVRTTLYILELDLIVVTNLLIMV